jgi:hypothetical protein
MATEPQPDERPTSARERATEAAAKGHLMTAAVWALVSIADDIAVLRRNSDHERRQGGGRRG